MPERRARIAFVVQRYGPEVVGGAELHCRLYAERLAEKHDVDVLTSCALDHRTWANHYPAGESREGGVQVRRFPVTGGRHPDLERWWEAWRTCPRTAHDELAWLYEQGPVVPDLLTRLVEHRDRYDVFVFFTYLYLPTALGLPLVADKSILVPTANPADPPLDFGIFRPLFSSPRAILYTTDEERDHAHRRLANRHVPHDVVGVGFDPVHSDDPARFARAHGLDHPYVLFLGRIGPGKGCDQLVADFARYLEAGGADFHLVLAGSLEMALPECPGIHHVGFLDGQDKADALVGASAVVVPGAHDCLSMAACEAWAAGRPVLVTKRSPVVRSLCRRSGGGADYRNAGQLAARLRRLARDPAWGGRRGRRGRAFVEREYAWPVVMRKLERAVRSVSEAPAHTKRSALGASSGAGRNR